MGKRRKYKADRWDDRFDWNEDDRWNNHLCTFRQGVCKGVVQRWVSPDGHLNMPLCEGHAERMKLTEEAWHAEPAEAGIVVP